MTKIFVSRSADASLISFLKSIRLSVAVILTPLPPSDWSDCFGDSYGRLSNESTEADWVSPLVANIKFAETKLCGDPFSTI